MSGWKLILKKKAPLRFQSRDELILRMIQSLARKGKMRDVVEAVREEGMVGELATIK